MLYLMLHALPSGATLPVVKGKGRLSVFNLNSIEMKAIYRGLTSLLFVGLVIGFIACQKDQVTNNTEQVSKSTLEDILKDKEVVEITFKDFDNENTRLVQEWDKFLSTEGMHISDYTSNAYDEQNNFLYGGGEVFQDEQNKSLSEIIALINHPSNDAMSPTDFKDRKSVV